MATIAKRTDAAGQAHYQVKVRIKGHPTQSATFDRLTDAKRWAIQTEAAIRERRHFKTAEAQKHTFAELVDRYVRDVIPTKAPGTQASQTMQMGWWKERLGALLLIDITPALIVEARDALVKQSSGSTANRYLAVLSHAFTTAVKEWQWTEDNPVLRVTKPTEPRGRVRFLSDEERERLLAACRQSPSASWLYPFVVLALSTGMRSGEMRGLTWDRVDLKGGTILLEHTKNGERRVIPLAGHARELLEQLGKVRRLDTMLVFPSRLAAAPGKPVKPVNVQHPWEQALAVAGIENFRIHDLRHSAASYMLMNGATIGELAEVLGHKTLQMVKRYSHLSEAHTRGIVERMNSAIFGGRS